jgi:hypothetical protein
MDQTTASLADVENEHSRQVVLAEEAEMIAQARISAKQVGTIPAKEMDTWIKSWDTDNELPRPVPRR